MTSHLVIAGTAVGFALLFAGLVLWWDRRQRRHELAEMLEHLQREEQRAVARGEEV